MWAPHSLDVLKVREIAPHKKKNKLTKSPISHGGNRENTQKKKVTEGDYTVTSRILGSIKNVKFSGEKVEVHTWMAEAKDRHPKWKSAAKHGVRFPWNGGVYLKII